MVTQVSFIGRQSDLEFAQDMITQTDRSCHYVFIKGEGGIGKTRFLQELHRRCQEPSGLFIPQTDEQPKYRIAILHEFTNTEWSQLFKAGLHSMASILGISAPIERDASDSPERMAKDLDEVVEMKPDVIIVRMGSFDILQPGLEKAIRAGIQVILFDNYLSLKLSKPIFCQLRVDEQPQALQLFQKVAADIDETGVVGIIWARSQLQERRRTMFDSAFLNLSDVKKVYKEIPVGRRAIDAVHQQTLALLNEEPDLRAIIVMWDAYTEIVAKVVREYYSNRTISHAPAKVYGFEVYGKRILDQMNQDDSVIDSLVITHPEKIGEALIRLAVSAASQDNISDKKLKIPAVMISRFENTAPIWSEYELGWTENVKKLKVQHLGEPQKYKIVNVIDLDDRVLHLPENLLRRLAEKLDYQEFIPYRQAIRDYQKVEAAGVSSQMIEKQRILMTDVFAECFNRIARLQRIILFMDTTDAIEDNSIWQNLLESVPKWTNCVIFIAGRNASEVMGLFEQKIHPSQLHLRPIQKLTIEESENYISRKVGILGIPPIREEVKEKLLVIAGGLPILIDLAMEWYARGMNLPSFGDVALEELRELQTAEIAIKRRELEKALVQIFAETQRHIDWLVLALSYVYPMDEGLAVAILPLDAQDAHALFENAPTYVFIKTLPDGRISLHDEMRRMIQTYIWPQLDSEPTRKNYYYLASNYLEQYTKELCQEFKKLRQEAELHDTLDYKEKEDKAREEEQKYWELLVELSDYALKTDITTGLQTVVRLFDDIPRFTIANIRGKMIYFAEKAIQAAQEKQITITPKVLFEYRVRKASHHIENLELDQGAQILDELEQTALDDTQKIDLLTRRARHAERTGQLPQAYAFMRKAVQMSESLKNLGPEWKGHILSTLGLYERMIGRWEDAQKHYSQAITLIEKTRQDASLSNTYNNLGYVIGLQHDYESAVTFCRVALEIQEKNGWSQSAARTLNTLGIIFRGRREYDAALNYTYRALDIFQKSNNLEWMSKAYCEMGITLWHSDSLESARKYLDISLQIARDKDFLSNQVDALHGLGHVAWTEGKLAMAEGRLAEAESKFTEAEYYFIESAEIAEKIYDARQAANSLQGLVELFYDRGYQFHQNGNKKERDYWYARSEEIAEEWRKKFDNQNFNFTLYSGDRIRTMGHIAYDQGDFDTALQCYLEAYPKTASPWGFSRNLFPEALTKLSDRIDKLDPDRAIEWCKKIKKEWIRKNLVKRAPGMIHTCNICISNAKRRKNIQKEKVA